MATPLDALSWREIYGRTLRRIDRGRLHARMVAPLFDGMTVAEEYNAVEVTRRSLLNCVDHGEVYYVSREMTEYLLHEIVEKHMQERRLFHLDQGDLPSRVGFVYFDGDVPMPSMYSRSGFHNMRCILWDQLIRGNDTQDNYRPKLWIGNSPDEGAEVIGKVLFSICETPDRSPNRDDFGPWKPRHWVPATYGVRMEPEMVNNGDPQDTLTRTNLMNVMDREKDHQDSVDSVATLFKLLTAWMAFIQTEIPVLHPRPASYDKVMRKEGRPPADVKVTLLRRYAHTTTDGAGMTEVDWAYRWKVKEHYRWQRVGPGRSMLRRTLVKEYWKGPEDKPKHDPDAVTALVR